jgi:peroxiredoxin
MSRRQGRPPRLSLGAVGWILLLGLLAWRISPQVTAAFGLGSGGEAMPELALRTLDGAPVTRDALAGKVVLVNFWATWCPPCRFEMPGFQRVYADKQDRGFVVLGVSTDNASEATVRRFLSERGISYPVAMATSRVVRDFGGVQALPTSFLIARDGTVRQQVRCVFAEPALRSAVNHLLDEPGKEAVR